MNEDELSDADLWEAKVQAGMPKDEATAYVRGRRTPADQSIPSGAGGSYAPESRSSIKLPATDIAGQLAAIRQGMFAPGFADEAHGVAAGLLALVPGGESPAEAYRRARDADRADLNRYRAEHPVATGAGEVLGGLLTGKYLPTSVGKVKGVRGTIRAAVEGAGYAGVAGAGASDGGIADRAKAGLKAAPFGVAAGGVLSHAIPAAAAGVSRIADIVGVRPAIAPRIPPGTEYRMTGGAEPTAGVRSVDERTNEMLVNALKADDLDPEGLMSGMLDTRGPVTPLDLGGDNLLGVARGARSIQGSRAKNVLPEVLGNRVRGQEERIIDYALQDSGLRSRTDVLGTVDDLSAKMSREAEASYGAIRGKAVDDPAVIGALRQPAFRRAYERAASIRENEIASATLSGERPPPALPSIDDLLAGQAKPTLGTLDQVKRGLDDVIYSSKREGLGKAEIGSLEQVRHAFVRKLDSAVPKYRAARSKFAGTAALRDALEEGGRLFEQHPDEARQVIDRMGASELEMYRKGAMEALMRKIESTSSRFDVTGRRPLDDVTLDRKRLRLLFKDEEGFQRFTKALKEEARMASVNRFVTGGSNTVDKLAELANVAGVDLGDIVSAASGGIGGMALKVADKLGRRAVQGYTTATADALAPKLIAGATGDRNELRQLITDLIAAQKQMEARAAGQASAARGAAGASGLLNP